MHFRRRPSAAMIIALVALFVALGGVGYAQFSVPAGSVGSAQLQTDAVTNHKIQNGAVGNHKIAMGAIGPRKMEQGAIGLNQINTSEVQARVAGTCSTGAITAVSDKGAVTCASAPAQEFDTSSASPVTVTATAMTPTAIASESVPGGSSYIAFANPQVQISDATAGQHVTLQCTLAVGPATTATQTRTVTVDIPSPSANEATSIPLAATAPSSTNKISVNLGCEQVSPGATSPTVKVSSNINVLQTAANTTTTAPTMMARR